MCLLSIISFLLLGGFILLSFMRFGAPDMISNNSRTNAEERMEIDFLVEKPQLTNAHNICPVEVKSGKNYTTVSLNKFRKKFERQLHTPYIIHYMDLKTEGGIVYLPIYMTPFLPSRTCTACRWSSITPSAPRT